MMTEHLNTLPEQFPAMLSFPRVSSRVIALLFYISFGGAAVAQQTPLSQRMANATVTRWPQGRFTAPEEKWKWNYELATLLNGMTNT